MESDVQQNFRKPKQFSILPDDIIEEVLVRLPVKSLLRFRCVSKSWRSLIGSKRFIQIHFEISKRNPVFAHHKIIVNCCPLGYLQHCSLHSLVHEPVTYASAFDDPLFPLHESIRVVGNSNGLICILIGRRDFYLWNPSMRLSKKLPFMDYKLKHGYITNFGFGFDESTGDYKVFAILSVFWVTGRYEAVGKVYSLKTNSWKKIVVDRNNTFAEGGTCVNGKIHWCTRYISQGDIISFDLQSELYGTTWRPPNLDDNFYSSLGEIGGCFCLFCDYPNSRVDVWVMQQYGVKESWNKMVTIPYPCDVPERSSLSVVCFMGREILLHIASRFLVYKLEDGNFRHPRMDKLEDGNFHHSVVVGFDQFYEVEVYVENLISPVSDSEQEGGMKILGKWNLSESLQNFVLSGLVQ